MSKKTEKDTDLDYGMAPAGVALREAEGPTSTPAGRIHAAVERDAIFNPKPDAEDLLIELESRCANGATVGLDEIRAVLAALRGA